MKQTQKRNNPALIPVNPHQLGQLADVDLRLLRVFRAVVEAGGLSAAELELNIGRSTISRHLKDLEVRLGMSLCRRGRAGFALTDEGVRIYQACQSLMASLESFRGEVNDVHKRLTGTLSIALFDKIAGNPNSKIHQALAQYDELAPLVTLEIYVEPLNVIEKGVMDGRFALGVIPAHRESSSLRYQALFEEQMYLYCGKNHPLFAQDDTVLNPDDVLQYKYAGLGYHSPNMQIGQRLAMQRCATVYDQEAIVHFLLSGRYLGYLPEHYAQQWLDLGLIRPIAKNHFQYLCEFMSISRVSPKPSRIVKRFLQCLAEAHEN